MVELHGSSTNASYADYRNKVAALIGRRATADLWETLSDITEDEWLKMDSGAPPPGIQPRKYEGRTWSQALTVLTAELAANHQDEQNFARLDTYLQQFLHALQPYRDIKRLPQSGFRVANCLKASLLELPQNELQVLVSEPHHLGWLVQNLKVALNNEQALYRSPPSTSQDRELDAMRIQAAVDHAAIEIEDTCDAVCGKPWRKFWRSQCHLFGIPVSEDGSPERVDSPPRSTSPRRRRSRSQSGSVTPRAHTPARSLSPAFRPHSRRFVSAFV